MTNSIASAKCSSVLTSGKYGMSQNYSIIDDSKEYIFVKLTDSAFRAIEEYQRNTQSKRLQKGQCAKIQFIGNAGVIHFPPAAESSSVNGPTDGRKFGFSIDDIEGSLECIQQSGADLDVLGSLNYRMRIHANDDVYDTTRTKMAIAEETEKSKCIREIKPNQTDIGRKVKRPVSAASIQAYTNSMTSSLNGIGNGSSNSISSSINGSSSYLSNNNNNHNSSSNNNSRNKLSSSLLTSPPSGGGVGGGSGGVINGSRLLSSASLRSSPNPSSMGNCSTVGGSGNSNSNNNRFGSPSNPPSSSLPSVSSNGINSTGSYSPPGSGLNHVNSNNHIAASLHSVQKKKGIGKCANSKGNGLVMSGGKGTLGGGKANGISNLKTLDVSRRKIRERLIHLLALKPFKKPELYSRLQNEGLAQRERQLISTILKDISTLSRDNTYNLRRSMWNDVDENWPFFSEQEIQQLKRRKPQNLTPPMSSDAGSSTSGQSPSSTHTGSPPPLVGGGNLTTLIVNGGGGGIKRTSLEPDLYDGDLTLVTQPKKQRISHYKKDGNNSSITNNGNLGAGARIGMGGSGSVGNGNVGGGNLYGGSTCQNHRPLSAAYSPHNYSTCNNNGNDDNSKNSDLTFNVLNNMDDFIQHTSVVGGDQNYAGRSKIISTNKIPPITSANGNSSNNNNSSSNSTISILKEKRNSGGNSSSSGSSNRESSLTSSAMQRKNSPTPYANNFVPETKISSKSYGSCNSGRMNQQHHTQRQQQVSPSYSSTNNINLHSHKSTNHINNKNSVIPNVNEDYTISPPLLVPSHTTSNHNGYSISSSSSVNRSQHHISSSSTSNGRSSEPSNNHSRSLTPTQKHSLKNSKNIQQQQELLNNTNFQLQQQEEETQQEVLYNDIQTSPQTASHLSLQSQEQEQSWPTQQIAAAASTFSLTNHFCMPWGDTPHYDFSSYTPITTIEQRRKYKTEFESDYDEYRILLAEIESVGHRFRELADRLNRVEQGCTDYYNIKDQILSEYNRVCKEEAINRDKQRFDYLHKKLAHIKQLVMDYDKKLTSGLAMTTSAPNQQQHHQQQQELQNQLQSTSLTNNSAHLSPMLQSSGESNHSPPLVVTNPTVALPKNSSPSKEKTSKYHQKNELQQHQQQSEHYQQHHDPETIKIDEETTSLQYHTYNGNDNNGNHFNREQQREQLHIVSPANLSSSAERKLQHQEQHPPEQQQLDVENHNDNDSESDSDSSSSSSSNDDDNSDDDISDASNDGDDDDNTDNDFNDDNHDQ